MPDATTREFLFWGGARGWNFDTRARAGGSIAVQTIRRGGRTPVYRVMLILHTSRNAISPNAPKVDDGVEMEFFASQKVLPRAPYASNAYDKLAV